MRWPRLCGFFLLLSVAVLSYAVEIPDLMRAKVFDGHVDVTQFWVSEKLDGVRARWDGKQLISKAKLPFAAPDWFIKGFPDTPLEGELWIARGHYEDVVSIVRKQNPHDGWKNLKLMVFDLPAHKGVFSERVDAMRQLASTTSSPYLAVIEQFRVESDAELMQQRDAVTQQGGEGLMLHRQSAVYQSGRSEDLLKVKPFEDAEAVVTGYKPGKGKNTGLMGSVHVRADNGKEFYIGSGFTQAQRKEPPPIGSVVNYRHQGLTDAGIPRFAVFVRMRNKELK